METLAPAKSLKTRFLAAMIGGLLVSATGAAMDIGGGSAAATGYSAAYAPNASPANALALRQSMSDSRLRLVAALRPARPATRPATVAKVFTRPTASSHAGQAVQAVQAAAQVATAEPTTVPAGYGCGPALAYLSSHAAPGFRFECPGYALGHQAMTCQNVAGVCPGGRLIVIHVPCAAAYMNEAYNSWIVEGLRSGSYDPYGYCH